MVGILSYRAYVPTWRLSREEIARASGTPIVMPGERSVAAWDEDSLTMATEAGIKDPRKELDFGIVHDCFTITELIDYQDMKLCKAGEGADLIKNGVTAIDGDFPINPDGGLKCFGHPIGATGVRMIIELTRQVLGKAEGLQVKDAEAGFAHNLGGPFSVGAVTIVGRP